MMGLMADGVSMELRKNLHNVQLSPVIIFLPADPRFYRRRQRYLESVAMLLPNISIFGLSIMLT